MYNQDTICAIATAPGGAIGIIRVSGKDAIQITDSIFTPAENPGKSLRDRTPFTLTFGVIKDQEGKVVDEVLVSLFKNPHSYTGEDATEISCHDSSFILNKVIQLLIENGCRAAGPGEFTQRAFLNGKMDLAQAEAVASLIASTSAATHRLAINQMRGNFSKEMQNLREQLLHITSLMELELDFSDHEELEFADRSELQKLADKIEHVIARLTQSFRLGNALKDGVPVAIIGETNTGKSTLLNTLLNENKAIVSEIHGTTRDVIEDSVNIDGITFRFIDTAGIRQTEDKIETIGIERTFEKLEQASIVLWMIDCTTALFQWSALENKILPHCKDKELFIVLNKADLLPDSQKEGLEKLFKDLSYPYIFISAKNQEHIDELHSMLTKASALPEINQDEIIVTNLRHYEALSHALDSIHRVQEGLHSTLPGDLISQDLRECIFYLGDIIGEVSTDSILKNIFEKFCIGK